MMLLVAGLFKKFLNFYTIYQLIFFHYITRRCSICFNLPNANWRDIINLILLFYVMQISTNNALIIID